MGTQHARLRAILLGMAVCLSLVHLASAAITTTGDVRPTPTTSSRLLFLYVGETADGSVLVHGAIAFSGQAPPTSAAATTRLAP